MTWWVTLSAGMGVLLLLLLLGVPIFVTFLALNVIGVLVLIGPSGFGMFANSIYSTGTFAELAAIPLFILMGELLFRSGAMEVVLDSMDRLIGRIRGRQYVLCVVLSGVLGALSGAAMAVAGMLARTLYPTMIQRGYDSRLSAGAILGGASLSPIIPPSVLAIVIATLAKVSTGKMLIAGIVPGILLSLLFLLYIMFRLARDPSLAPQLSDEQLDPKTRGSLLKAFFQIVPVGFIFFMVMGLIMLGIATPTESAAAGVFAAVLLAWYYGGLSFSMLKTSLLSAASMAGLLLIIMASAGMFSQLVTFSGTVQALGRFVIELDLAPLLMLLIMLLVPFVLFMFLDQISLLMVLIPIYQPILNVYEFDSIWFWTLVLVITTLGGISPPFGYTLFAFKSAAKEMSLNDVFRAAWPFVGIIICGIALLIAFPEVVLFLPELSIGAE